MEFADRGTEDLYEGRATAAARRACPPALRRLALRKLDLLATALSLESLRVPPGNRLEALRGDRVGQHAIRINDQYRLCFQWTDAGPTDVEIRDYH